jgi:MFS family permease
VDAGRYKWVVLAVGTVAQASTAAYFLGLAAVTPALRAYYGTGVAGVGALIGVTSVGLIATLVAWGAATDRFGERGVMTVGLAGAAAALGAAALVRSPVAAGALLVAAGASGASVNAASGRAVLTWFPAQRRGLAMAVRQTSVPLGAAGAAVVLPALAGRGGVPAVFAGLAAGCVAAGVATAVWIREPPDRPATGRAPASTRAVLADGRLLRLSLAGGLLVVPQFLGSVFLVELLHTGRGVAPGTAAALLSVTQVLGAAGRLGNGVWSDRAGRMRPLRIVALAIAAAFTAAAAAFAGPLPLLAVVLIVAAALAISWNGLVFTAAGELAPPGRAATAMAMTNTANYMGAAITPAVGGAVAAGVGWPAMLALGAVAALAALLALRGLQEGPAQQDRCLPATAAQNSRRRS